MRIAVLHPSLNLCGGAERVSLAIVRALRKAGHEVTLVTIDKTDWSLLREIFGEDLSVSVEERFLFVRTPGMLNATLRGFFTVLFYLFEVFLVRFLGNFDLLVVSSGELVDSFGDVVYVNALPLRLIHLYPGVIVERGVWWRCYSRLYDLFLKVLGRLHKGSLLLTNSEFNRDILRRYLGKDALVLYPPVDVKRFGVSAGNFDREDLIVTVSRFRPGKMLESVPKVARIVERGRFLIFGPGDEASEKTLRELEGIIWRFGVEGRVRLLVGESAGRLLKVLSSAKVLLHTQPYEAFGLAVVEGMAAGCVPVVPRVGGPWLDILGGEEGRYGFSYGSVREAAKKIERLLRDEKLWRSLSTRASRRAKKFDASVFQKGITELVE